MAFVTGSPTDIFIALQQLPGTDIMTVNELIVHRVPTDNKSYELDIVAVGKDSTVV